MMLNISTGRFIWTFLVGFFVCSNLNWGIAEFFERLVGIAL